MTYLVALRPIKRGPTKRERFVENLTASIRDALVTNTPELTLSYTGRAEAGLSVTNLHHALTSVVGSNALWLMPTLNLNSCRHQLTGVMKMTTHQFLVDTDGVRTDTDFQAIVLFRLLPQQHTHMCDALRADGSEALIISVIDVWDNPAPKIRTENT